MRRLAVVLSVALCALSALSALIIACGGGDNPQPTGTATSERAERQETVSQASDQDGAPVQETDTPSPTAQSSQSAQPEQSTQAAQSSDSAPSDSSTDADSQPQDDAAAEQAQSTSDAEPDEEQAVATPVDVVGEHKGLRSERNVLGDPDASVEIRYYGDFT